MRKRIKFHNGVPHKLVRYAGHDKEVFVKDNTNNPRIFKKKTDEKESAERT